MKKITAVTMFILAIMATFFETANAGIISKEYDAVSDEMLIDYKVLDKDRIWNICNELTIKQMDMGFIEKNIMTPNNITDPKKLSINTVLKIRIKRSNFRDPVTGTILAKESLLAEIPQIANIAARDMPQTAVNHILSTTKSGDASGNNASVSKENQLPAQEYEKNNEELRYLLEVATVKIADFGKTITAKNSQITEMQMRLNNLERGIKKSNQGLQEINTQNNLPDRAVVQFERGRNQLFSVIFVLIVIAGFFTLRLMKRDHNQYSCEGGYWSVKGIRRKIKKLFEPKPALSSSS
ncbi:hypothetical protein HGB13_05115 [bacterium]|nr:hypothetical protein [bacterium]